MQAPATVGRVGTWLAVVQFPDGTRRYGSYSTVVESLLSHLYADMVPEGGTFADGSVCYRSRVTGEPEREFPDATPADLDELVAVVITTEPDEITWHALYCPRRAVVLGPMSPHHVYALQERFEVVPDGAGVRHLRRACPEEADAVCGRAVSGEPLPFHTPFLSDGRIGYEDVPGTDLYAGWSAGDVCRECLVSQVPEVEDDRVPDDSRPSPLGLTPYRHPNPWTPLLTALVRGAVRCLPRRR